MAGEGLVGNGKCDLCVGGGIYGLAIFWECGYNAMLNIGK
jgi:hypothetical protein